MTLDGYRKSYMNIHVIKAKGFSSFETLQAFVDGAIQSNPKLKKAELSITPKVVIANVKSNDHLLADGPRNEFLARLKNYVKVVTESRKTSRVPNPSTDPLRTIQDHCLLLANLRLASETYPKTMSLHEYANATEIYPNRVLPVRDLGNLIKTVQKSETEINLLETPNIHVSYNCFHCSQLAIQPGTVTAASAAIAEAHKDRTQNVRFLGLTINYNS